MNEESNEIMAGPSNMNMAGTCDSPWLKTLYNDDDADEKEEMHRSVKLLRLSGRRYTWWLCKILGADYNGIPAQTIQLLERYLASYMRLDDETTTANLLARKRTITTRLPLFIAVCAWLATKINGTAERRLNATLIVIKLREKNIPCDVNKLILLEMDVFRRINYRIPLWTTFEKANMLATFVGFTGDSYKSVEHMMKLAELLRENIQTDVIKLTNKSTPNEGTSSTPTLLRNIRNGHYCGAVVIAVTLMPDYSGPDPNIVLQKLVKLTRSSSIYLKTIATAIFSKMNITAPPPPSPTPPPAPVVSTRRKPNILRRRREFETDPNKRRRL